MRTNKLRGRLLAAHLRGCATAFQPTAVSLMMTSALVVMAAPAGAQEARVEFSIPAQSLDSALRIFTQQSKTQVLFDEATVAGLRAPAVNGSYTPREALARLLAGTGVTANVSRPGVFTLKPASGSGENMLAPLTVTADAERSGTTEGTGSYTTRSTATATKLPLSLRETPQTVTVVTRQQMDDFGLTNVDNVLESISGVYVYQWGGNGNHYYSRGFTVQAQYDGMPNPIGMGNDNRAASPDSAFLDRAEVLQGASGLLSGAGEPGGTVNLVRKRPTDLFQANIQAQLGSWDKKRIVGDISGPVMESGRIRGRAVVLQDESKSFIDYKHDDKNGFYGVIDADLTEATTISASVQYQKNDGNTHYGLPTARDGRFLDLGKSTFLGGTHDRIKKESTLYSLKLEQKLPGDWIINAAYTYTDAEVDNIINYLNGGPLNSITGSGLSLRQQAVQRKWLSNALDVYASGPFEILGRRHELVFGANGSKMEGKTRSGGVNTPINVYQYNPKSLPPLSATLADWPAFDETRQHGFFGAARLNLADSLKLILGTRVSWYEYRNAGGMRTHDENSVLSPYAGAIYDLNEKLSAYASYSDIFKAQNNLDSSGNPLDPIVGANYEAGIKGDFHGGRLNAGAAIFRLEQTNMAERDENFGNNSSNICGGWCYVAKGKIISQGVDLNLNGEIYPGWNIGAGYTYTKSEYGYGANKGAPYRTQIPKHNLRAFTTYRLPASNWTVGGNIRAQGRMYATGTTSGTPYRIEQGGVAIFSLMARYQFNKQAEISLAVDNLFDRTYYTTINTPIYANFYGDPRRFTMNMKYAF